MEPFPKLQLQRLHHLNHLYRNPAGVRMSGTLVTKVLVIRVALAAVLPLLLLLINGAAQESADEGS